MEIIISGRHFDVKAELRAYASDRAEKLMRYFDGITKINVTLGAESGLFSAEMVISASKHLVMIGEVHHRDLRAAIDLVTDKMERQLTRQKEKIKGHRDRHHVSEPSVPVAEAAGDAEDHGESEVEEE